MSDFDRAVARVLKEVLQLPVRIHNEGDDCHAVFVLPKEAHVRDVTVEVLDLIRSRHLRQAAEGLPGINVVHVRREILEGLLSELFHEVEILSIVVILIIRLTEELHGHIFAPRHDLGELLLESLSGGLHEGLVANDGSERGVEGNDWVAGVGFHRFGEVTFSLYVLFCLVESIYFSYHFSSFSQESPIKAQNKDFLAKAATT